MNLPGYPANKCSVDHLPRLEQITEVTSLLRFVFNQFFVSRIFFLVGLGYFLQNIFSFTMPSFYKEITGRFWNKAGLK